MAMVGLMEKSNSSGGIDFIIEKRSTEMTPLPVKITSSATKKLADSCKSVQKKRIPGQYKLDTNPGSDSKGPKLLI